MSLLSAFRHPGTAPLPDQGPLPGFDGATGWLNSKALAPDGLRGQVVLVQFWTYTCVNWLRTLPYVRAWNEKYGSHGLAVVGVHTPEFGFEHNVDNIVDATKALRVTYPIAVDSDYGVWRTFNNHFWPALYMADAEGRIRFTHFGEGEYEMTEMVIQQLLREAARDGFDPDLVSVDPQGTEVSADWRNVKSPESYLGYGQAAGFASPDGERRDTRHDYSRPTRLGLNQWAPIGEWTCASHASLSNAHRVPVPCA
jgi:thiol-disulfide isomerase/thioredoxin